MRGFDLKKSDIVNGQLNGEALARLTGIEIGVVDVDSMPHARQSLGDYTPFTPQELEERVQFLYASLPHMQRIFSGEGLKALEESAANTHVNCQATGAVINYEAAKAVVKQGISSSRLVLTTDDDAAPHYFLPRHAVLMQKRNADAGAFWQHMCGLSKIERLPNEDLHDVAVDLHEAAHAIQVYPHGEMPQSAFEARTYNHEIYADRKMFRTFARAKLGRETTRAWRHMRYLQSLVAHKTVHSVGPALDALDVGRKPPTYDAVVKAVQRFRCALMNGGAERAMTLPYDDAAYHQWLNQTHGSDTFTVLGRSASANVLKDPLARHIARKTINAVRYFCGNDAVPRDVSPFNPLKRLLAFQR